MTSMNTRTGRDPDLVPRHIVSLDLKPLALSAGYAEPLAEKLAAMAQPVGVDAVPDARRQMPLDRNPDRGKALRRLE